MTSITQEFKIFLRKILDIFVLLVTFELLSHYPNIILIPFAWKRLSVDHR